MPADSQDSSFADVVAALQVQIAEQAEAHAAIVNRLETAITELQEENLALQA